MNEKKQLKGLSLALNQITKQSISSYWWALDISELAYESVREDFGDEVDKSDYCYLYAVLQKEWIFEDLKEAINEAMEDILSQYYELYENPRLYYDWKYYKSEWIKDNEHKLVEVQ